MRLSEMRMIIRENREKLKIDLSDVSGNPNIKSVSNIPRCLKALDALKAVPSLTKIIERAESVQIICQVRTEQPIMIDTSKINLFTSTLSLLRTHCDAILSLADNILPEMSENTICIKLPDNITPDSLNEITETLSRFFDSLIPDGESHDIVRFIGVESGCSWIYFSIVLTTVLTIAKKAISLITEAFEKYIQIKKSLLDAQSMQLDFELKEEETALKKKILRSKLSQLENEQSPEQFEKLIASSVALLKIMEKGTEIHPPLTEGHQDAENETIKVYERIQSTLNDLQLLSEGLSQPAESEASQDPVPEDSCGDSNPIEK